MRSMTEQEAKEQLEAFFEYDLSMDEQIGVRMGIKALEKQIPKKVVNIQGNPTWGYCPSCSKTIDKSGSPNGCKWCLQRVDWSDEDDRD